MAQESRPPTPCSLNDVRRIATAAHAGQFRRDGCTPYINHPAAVVSRLSAEDEATQMVAWLHDVLEDTAVTPDDLLHQSVPENVIQAVELMTHQQHEAYEIYLARLKTNPLAVKVKIADMLTNLADSPTTKQIRKYAHGLLILTE